MYVPELEYVPHGGDSDEGILEDVYECDNKIGTISAAVPQIQNTETESEPDIPTVMVSAKTGHDEPVKQIVIAPEPTEQTADIDAAIATAEQFAVEMYHVTIDHTLDFDNSGYRFPAAVPLTVSQETFDAKAIDIVTFTFEQMIQIYGKTLKQVRTAGFRCRVCVVKGSDLQIYCLYA